MAARYPLLDTVRSALTSTAAGRALLAAADATAQRALLSLGGAALLNVGSGLTTSGSDLTVDTSTIASRSYVDATVGGLLYKRACRAVATSNVASLSGTTTIDGVSLSAGDRVLLTAQSTASQNGPWVVAAGSWSRPSPTELQASAAFPVSEGTSFADTIWYVITNDPITQGVTSVVIAQATMTVTSSGISDATTAGRALLTAANAAAQRSALSLGGAATLSVGNTAGTVAAGDDPRITGAAQKASNLSDVASTSTARTNLGVQDGPRELPIFAYATSASAAATRIAFRAFTPSLHAITGRTTQLTLAAVGAVSGAGITGTLELIDTADNSVVATLTWTETTPTAKTVGITLPGSAKVYRARVSATGITDTATQFAEFGSGVLRLSWS